MDEEVRRAHHPQNALVVGDEAAPTELDGNASIAVARELDSDCLDGVTQGKIVGEVALALVGVAAAGDAESATQEAHRPGRLLAMQGSNHGALLPLYAERGLARRRVSIWLYDGRLQIHQQETLLAQYVYSRERKTRRITALEQPQVFRTAFQSPQLELWELDDDQWRKVQERPFFRHARYAPTTPKVQQLLLPPIQATS